MPDAVKTRQTQSRPRDQSNRDDGHSFDADIRSRLATLEEALAQQRNVLIELKESRMESNTAIQNITKAVSALRAQIPDLTNLNREISSKVNTIAADVVATKDTTAEVATKNVEAIRDMQQGIHDAIQVAVERQIGSFFLSGTKRAVQEIFEKGLVAACIGVLGYLWFHVIRSVSITGP